MRKHVRLKFALGTQMETSVNLETPVTLRQAFLVMFAYLDQHWENVGRPDDIGQLLSELTLWETKSGGREPMDASIFPDWLRCAQLVLDAEACSGAYDGANIKFDGETATSK